MATVVLQLVERGRIDLDAPVERYLPGLVRGNGNDGRKTGYELLGMVIENDLRGPHPRGYLCDRKKT